MPNNATPSDGAPTGGSLQNCPLGTGTVEYGLEASGPGGTSRQVRDIRVLDRPSPGRNEVPAPERLDMSLSELHTATLAAYVATY